MFLKKDIPAWYDLGIKETTLQIWVRNDAFQFFVSRCSQYYFIDQMTKLSCVDLIPPTNYIQGVLGFGSLCNYQPDKMKVGWTLCEIALPAHNQHKLWRPCVCTLALLLNILNGFTSPTKRSPDSSDIQLSSEEGSVLMPQLITVDVIWNGGYNDCGLTVSVSSALSKWIAHQPEGEHEEIGQAIKTVARHMRLGNEKEIDDPDIQKCRAEFDARNGASLSCNGDMSELCHGGVQSYKSDPGPYILGTHNVDNLQQELSLFAGAAKLCEVARRAID
jgi:hypothetical protein